MIETYILDGEIAIVETDMLKWGEWMEDINNRRVALDVLGSGEVISTVFLGTEHNLPSGDVPILFETLISGGDYDNYIFRYCTWQQAEKGHKLIVRSRLDGDVPELAKGE